MPRIILLPGLGADERIFENLGAHKLPLEIPRHTLPAEREDLPAYARRIAEDLCIGEDDVVGGASFGAVIASAIARDKGVRGLILIGGALDSTGLRPIPGEHLLHRLPTFVLRSMLRSDRAIQTVFAPEGPEVRRLARTMLAQAPDDLLLRGGKMLMAYRPPEIPSCPIFALHGGRDPVMIPPPVSGCRIVPEAGHALPWTHGHEVTEFLQQAWESCRALPSPPPP